MDDLISRQKAIDVIKETIEEMRKNGTVHASFVQANGEMIIFGLEMALNMLQSLPSAQPERKTGKWNFIGDNMFECTSCGVVYTTRQLNGLRNYDTDPYAPKFCPNCGAEQI